MELRQVRSFVILAELLHFGRTARVLHLSQPALTKQIRQLEEELGGQLLARNKHGAALSALGHQFLPGARALVQDAAELLEATRRTARGDAGRLRLGFGFHTFELVPNIIFKLRNDVPAAEVSLRDMSTAEQIEALRSEKIDLGFMRLPVPADFETQHVIEDWLMLVSSDAEELPLTVRLEECRDRPFVIISRDRSPTLHRHVLSLCAKHGFHPRVIQEAREVTTALALVRAGLGLAIVPQSCGKTRFAGVRFHILKEEAARYTVSAAWRKGDDNPLIPRFLTLLETESTSVELGAEAVQDR